MAKRYQVKWGRSVEISMLRGKKKTEAAFSMKPIVVYWSEIFSEFAKTLESASVSTVEQALKELEAVKQRIKQSGEQEFIFKEGRLYYKCKELDVDVIRRALSGYHKRHAQGSYHLLDKDRVIIRKGQLTVPKHYWIKEYVNQMPTHIYYGFRRWKRELFCYFSEWEWQHVMFILFLHHCRPNDVWMEWAKQRYEERADYLMSLMPKNIDQFFFWHLVQRTK